MTSVSDISARQTARQHRIILAIVLLAWLVVVVIAGGRGVFEAGPARPPLPIFIAVALPPVLFALLYRASRHVREFALSLDLRLVTAMQAWRIGGTMFLVLYSFGMLPGLFAWPAGIGDVAVGLAAPFVLQAMNVERRGWERYLFWHNIAGLADFAGAIATGVLSSNSAIGFFASAAPTVSMGLLPLSLIPTFAVPLWIILHMISLIRLRRIRAGI